MESMVVMMPDLKFDIKYTNLSLKKILKCATFCKTLILTLYIFYHTAVYFQILTNFSQNMTTKRTVG